MAAGTSHAQNADGVLTVPVFAQIATCPRTNQPERSQAWLQAHVEAANLVFKPHRILLLVSFDAFEFPRCDLTNRADRNAVAAYVRHEKVVPVVVVNKVRDLEVPTYNLMGVHWRYGGKRPGLAGRRWIFLTARAEPPVLAHELCHFFGLPHDREGGNLMTPGPSSSAWRSATPPRPFAPVLTQPQANALRAGIRLWDQNG